MQRVERAHLLDRAGPLALARAHRAQTARDLLVSTGLSATDAAQKLGVSRQAVGQRLAAGGYQQERDGRPVAADLLARAEGTGHPVAA